MKLLLLLILFTISCTAEKHYEYHKRGSVAENGDVPRKLIKYHSPK